MASTVGQKNPYRYRGYRYDTETGLYYLQSRYYNPAWGRFVNADDINYSVPGLLLTYNLYAYCLNNPVNHDDPDGNVIPLIAAAVATAPSWVPVVAGVTTAVISGITVGTMVGKSRIVKMAVAGDGVQPHRTTKSKYKWNKHSNVRPGDAEKKDNKMKPRIDKKKRNNK